MKKYIFLLTATIIAAAVLIFFSTDIYKDLKNNSIDKGLWQELTATFKEDRISGVYLLSKNQVQLSNDEKSYFIKNLQKAEFERSNWRGEGPTGPIIVITYKDGSKVSFQYWGGALFEMMYKNRQFLISSMELGNTMKKYNFLP